MASHRLSKLGVKAHKRRIAEALVGVKGEDFGIEVDRLLAVMGYQVEGWLFIFTVAVVIVWAIVF